MKKMTAKKKLQLASVALAGLFTAQLVFAAPFTNIVAGDTVKLYDVPGEGSTNGGAFRVDVQGKGTTDDFHTFCLEKNEYFSYGELLTVKAINTGAVNGGLGGQTSSNFDPLDGRTAWLYTQYTSAGYGVLGSLGANAYTANDASGDAFQNAVWYLEGEISSVSGQALAFVTAANGSGWSTLVGGNWVTNTIGDVRVMNLVHADGSVSQDQLTMIPEPETYAMLLAGLGLMGLVARRRKQKNLAI